MGLLIDYFSAPSDAEAATALDAGPDGRFVTINGAAIEPVVNLGLLEELLSGRS